VSRKITIKEAEARYPDFVKNQRWRTACTKYKFCCPIHRIYRQRFSDHKRYGCKQCGHFRILQKRTKTHKQFLSEMRRVNPNISVLGTYQQAHSKILVRHKKCGREWSATPDSLLHNHGCMPCAASSRGIKRLLTIGEVEARHPAMVRGQVWRGYTASYKYICQLHGIYDLGFHRHNAGYGCQKCSESQGEKRIVEILTERDLVFTREKRFASCRNQQQLPFDFFIPALDTLIEFHGGQHYKPIKFFGGVRMFRYRCKLDRIKERWARNNGLKLIVVPYTVKDIEAYLTKRLGTPHQFRKAA
jgi:hypothetical protein